MTKTVRLGAIAFGLLTLLAGVTYAYPAWPESVGLDFWNVPTLNNALEAQERRAAELDAVGDAILIRIAAKAAAGQDLIDGVIDLRQAAERFLELNAADPRAIANMRKSFEGETDIERAARQAIRFIEPMEGQSPSPPPGLIGRLEAELARWRSN